ncbi:hypothetical protein [Paraburkholderia sediminicola]|uniref:hypothetical protein n=1 Tax=Paraburkholderia sediminicola TaxID=458836 RepID=UPI0038BB2A14
MPTIKELRINEPGSNSASDARTPEMAKTRWPSITEWEELKMPDFVEVKKFIDLPVIFDGHNRCEPEVLADASFEYFGFGLSNLNTCSASSWKVGLSHSVA